MSAPVLYQSTDAGAPALSGQVGALVAVLDAILVNGYGAKPAAGWSKAFSGTNKAAYRAPAGTRLYLQVLDNAPGAGGAKEARCRGYETMTDVDTGGNGFPTAAQLSAGIIARKSETADATARAWLCLADDRTFYFFALANGTRRYELCFGDIYSLKSGDAFSSFIIGGNVENVSTSTNFHNSDDLTDSSTEAGHYLARSYTAAVGSLNFMKCAHGTLTDGNSEQLQGRLAAPNPPDGEYWVFPVWVGEPAGINGNIRGRLRGVWAMCTGAAGDFTDLDTMFGTGRGLVNLSGKTFMVLRKLQRGGSATEYMILLETSTWETN